MTIFKTLRLGAAIFLASISALALADNFLRDDGTFQPVTSSSQSVTATAPITVTPSPCVGSCVIALTTPLTVPQGGTGNITATAHSLPINEGTSAQANTGAGSTGQCLASGGAAADPAYVGGCMVLLATLTPSGVASIGDTTHITSTYNEYEVIVENLLPASGNPTCEIQVFVGSYQTSGYISTAVVNGTGVQVTTYIPCSNTTGDVSSAQHGVSGIFRIHLPSSTTVPAYVNGQTIYANATPIVRVNNFGGWYNTTGAAVTGFQMLFSGSINIASGIIKIYGRL